jgi:hypothetical protein
MTATAPTARGRNLLGVAAFAVLLVGLLGPWSPLGGDGWAWFSRHPGAFGSLVVAVCTVIAVTVLSGRAGVALIAAVVVGVGLYVYDGTRTTIGGTEKVLIGTTSVPAKPAPAPHRPSR